MHGWASATDQRVHGSVSRSTQGQQDLQAPTGLFLELGSGPVSGAPRRLTMRDPNGPGDKPRRVAGTGYEKVKEGEWRAVEQGGNKGRGAGPRAGGGVCPRAWRVTGWFLGGSLWARNEDLWVFGERSRTDRMLGSGGRVGGGAAAWVLPRQHHGGALRGGGAWRGERARAEWGYSTEI